MSDESEVRFTTAWGDVWHVTWGSNIVIFDPNAPRVKHSRWRRFKDDVRWRVGSIFEDLAADFGAIGEWFDGASDWAWGIGNSIKWGRD